MKVLRQLIITAVLFTATAASAQVSEYAGTMYASMSEASFSWMEDRIATLDEVVNLTDDQQVAVKEITVRYAYRVDALFKKEMEPEKLAFHKNDLFKYRMDDYKQILTPAQISLLEENIELLQTDNKE